MKKVGAVIMACWPVFAGIVVGLGFSWVGGPMPPNEAYAPMMAASAGISAILVGFLSATKAVILSISGSRTYRNLRRGGYLNDLFSHIKVAIGWAIAFAVFCISLMFFEPTYLSGVIVDSHRYGHPLMSIWVGVATVSVASFWRVSRYIFKILELTE